jgi:sulfatase modifying factor 1
MEQRVRPGKRRYWPWLVAVLLRCTVHAALAAPDQGTHKGCPYWAPGRDAVSPPCVSDTVRLSIRRGTPRGCPGEANTGRFRKSHMGREPAPSGMIRIPGGEFWMGCDDSATPDARPFHRVRLSSFWIDRTEVTNQQFARFVRATGYVTVAERKPDPRDFPSAPPDSLVPGSLVFTPPGGKVSLTSVYGWWRYQPGANWRHPEGPGSDLKGRENHPVVHVAWEDAAAYARWAGQRLPTEAEWEFAARGGLDRQRYGWGNTLKPGGKWPANIWQGHFPDQNRAEDGFRGTAPVASFPANGYGLYDMSGNVWEWCADWYRPDTYQALAAANSVSRNPKGPKSSFDPREPGIAKRVQRGGSFLCCDQYCSRYIVGARGKGAVDSGTSHVGFRCVRSAR